MKKSFKKFVMKIRAIVNDNHGFSMIELMIVVAIMAVLAGLIATNFTGMLDKAKVTRAQSDIETFGKILDAYKITIGNYPGNDEGLKKLLDEGLIKKKKDALLDPWGNPYNYRYPGQSGDNYEIWSLGADGKEGGEGFNKDLKSWE